MESSLLEFECVGIEDGGKIPIENIGRGRDISPEFVIKNLSPKEKTLAVTLEDLSHPVKNFTHWIIWNISAADRIEKGIGAGKEVPALGNATQGIGYGFHRYAGPKPPKGKKHIYRFSIYSLDCESDLSASSLKKTFLKKVQGHILQKGSITGEFEWSITQKMLLEQLKELTEYGFVEKKSYEGYPLHVEYSLTNDMGMEILNESQTADDFVQGRNSWTSIQGGEQSAELSPYYGGMTPPDKLHIYELHVYALDKMLDLEPGFLLNELYHQMDGHILEEYTLKGIYEN